MKREPASARRVVHVVGRVTDDVFGFLAPATAALARAGHPQAVVMIDDLRDRHRVSDLHEEAELVKTPSLRNPIGQWRAMLLACRQLMRGDGLHAVHLHGLLPGIVGARAARDARVDAPVFFSPNGSRAIMRLRGLGLPVVLWAARPLLRPRRHAAAQVRLPAATPRWAPEVPVEAPIHQAFFRVPRSEARRPLIVTGGRLQGPGNAELTAQLAVLLNDEDLGIGFNWIGAVDEVSRTRLNAAGVGVFEVRNEADCAARLGAGWIYLAPGSPRGFAQCLVEAMAAGLPCVALDSEAHRELIRDGESGFLCQTERDMLNRIAALIDDPALRERIGRAARHEACGRFGESQFGAKLLAAYALDV